ncbi:alkaline phosphatase D family protein [Hydrogenophaga sp.]|uniref:alkaline phosphatase D family protein n=1 Tax=Hydrogenophaga sp. TaxID=1904254 RepID=UPI00262CB4A6|nr:alkaline phosphatase D family protein [Hydrogenophaga sp.]
MAISNRRSFIIRVASASAAVAAGGLLSACGGGDDNTSVAPAPVPARFDFGVASGDPLADRVVLWTHAAPANGQSAVNLIWEVARDAGFTQVVSSGQVQATAAAGFTAKVDATGLAAGQSYFYRFREGSNNSPVGRTRTLPASGVGSVKMAVFSCANYPAGFFHAYSEAVNQGAEYAVHLGDYIYEYPANGYASQDAVALGRVSTPANECFTLADYRARYAQYRSDPDLKRLHASLPLIAVWDDHEIANDAYVTGAENHTEGAEGAFTDRVAAALKVWHEWMPVRTPDMTDLRKIYRSFDCGNLLSLHMLETRLLGRDKGVELPDLVNPATQAAALASLSSTSRQMMGATQQTWLQQQMAASSATWQVLGQQVLMARMAFPVSILQALDPSNTDPVAQANGLAAITDYLTAKNTPAGLRTLTQVALLDPAINPQLGYNLDAWDGYPVAREVLLGTAATLGKRLVTLAGDTHNAWHSDLTLMGGAKVGEEFATPGVSSPGLEEYLSAIPPAQAAGIFTGVIDTLNYADTSRRGWNSFRLNCS